MIWMGGLNKHKTFTQETKFQANKELFIVLSNLKFRFGHDTHHVTSVCHVTYVMWLFPNHNLFLNLPSSFYA